MTDRQVLGYTDGLMSKKKPKIRRVHLKPRRKRARNSKLGFLGNGTKLNRRIIKQFCDLIKMGRTVDSVCDFLGIPNNTFWSWMRRGEKYLNGNCEPEGHYLYGLLMFKLKKATAQYRFSMVDKLHNAGKGTWIKFMAILERRDRKNFSRLELPGGGEDSMDADERFM